MSEPILARHVIVHGKVQGVGFRDFVDHNARQRNLTGWVRNRRNGTVEAVFVGLQGSVEGMIGVCRVGPPSGNVNRVDQRDAAEAEVKTRGATDGEFLVLPTV